MAGLKLAPVHEGEPAIEIQGDRATVGRTAGVDHIVNDPSVSRQHALFERQAAGWTVTDQGSANGTFVDGQRVTTAEIREGQEVRFGAKAFRVHIDWAEMPTAFMPAIAPPPPVPPRPVPPPAPRPPLVQDEPLPPTIPPQRGLLVAPPRPPVPHSEFMANRRVPPAGTPPAPVTDSRPRGMAQAAFISGCLSIFLCPAPIAIVIGILGILDVRRVPGRVGIGRSIFGLGAGLVGSVALGLVLLGGFLGEVRRSAATTTTPRSSAPAVPVPTATPDASVVILSKDGALRIAAPAGWRSESNLNKNAELQACDAAQQVCIAVFEDDKKVTGVVPLERFSRIVRGQMLKKLTGPSESTGVSLEIGGHPALQFEIRGRADRFDLVYLHTSVETPGHFYQVMGWTSSALFPRERAVISAVTTSFQPAAGR